jgi:DegV family protein with EDD domain
MIDVRTKMSKIAVLTDSVTCLPPKLAEEHNIHVIPIHINFGGKSYRDGVDIAPAQFYKVLRQTVDLPTTSSPSVGEYQTFYRELGREAEAIVCITYSGSLGMGYSSALTASKTLNSPRVHVVDSRTVLMAEGFLALEAARAAAGGEDLASVVRRVNEFIPKVNLFIVFETLEYLHRGGRIGKAEALLGSLLQVKPILCVPTEKGVVDVLGKARTKRKALSQMLNIMAERVGDNPVHAAVQHADVPEEAQSFMEEIVSRFNCVELHLADFSPVVGTHTGPGAISVAFYTEIPE